MKQLGLPFCLHCLNSHRISLTMLLVAKKLLGALRIHLVFIAVVSGWFSVLFGRNRSQKLEHCWARVKIVPVTCIFIIEKIYTCFQIVLGDQPNTESVLLLKR